MTHVYPEEFTNSITELVVGQKIVSVIGDTFTLDNGKMVTLTGTSDCCAWGDIGVDAATFIGVDHVITSVKEVMHEHYREAQWFLLADMREVLRLSGEWDESNGYYMYGFNIQVRETSND